MICANIYFLDTTNKIKYYFPTRFLDDMIAELDNKLNVRF